MLPISRILAPVDFSERDLEMTPYLREFAKRYNCEVILLHVVNPFVTVPPTGWSGPIPIPLPDSLLAERRERLERFATDELQGLQVQRIIYAGDPASQIVEFARGENIGLIAMPTHGYGVLRRFLLGSETAKILHDVSCPVLTGVHVREQSALRAATISTVLCAVNLGPQSQAVLAWAAGLASDFNAKLRLLHVLEPLHSGLERLLSTEMIAKRENDAQEKIQELARKSGAAISATDVSEGSVAETVDAEAKRQRADLIVIGRGAADGSEGRLSANAYAIIRKSPCPVISVGNDGAQGSLERNE